jgi:hypothetical protein
MKKEDFELNPDSDRYRECLNCKAPFMATHRSRKFCDNYHWCHDEFNNGLKRKKKKEDLQKEVDQEYKEKSENTKDYGSLENNLKILYQLDIPSEGSEIQFSRLISMGFNPTKHSYKTQQSVTNGIKNYLIHFGDYTMIMTNPETVQFIETKYTIHSKNNTL